MRTCGWKLNPQRRANPPPRGSLSRPGPAPAPAPVGKAPRLSNREPAWSSGSRCQGRGRTGRGRLPHSRWGRRRPGPESCGTRTLTWAPLTTTPAMAAGTAVPGLPRARDRAGTSAAAASQSVSQSVRQSADAGGSAAGPRVGVVAARGSRRHLRLGCARPRRPRGVRRVPRPSPGVRPPPPGRPPRGAAAGSPAGRARRGGTSALPRRRLAEARALGRRGARVCDSMSAAAPGPLRCRVRREGPAAAFQQEAGTACWVKRRWNRPWEEMMEIADL